MSNYFLLLLLFCQNIKVSKQIVTIPHDKTFISEAEGLPVTIANLSKKTTKNQQVDFDFKASNQKEIKFFSPTKYSLKETDSINQNGIIGQLNNSNVRNTIILDKKEDTSTAVAKKYNFRSPQIQPQLVISEGGMPPLKELTTSSISKKFEREIIKVLPPIPSGDFINPNLKLKVKENEIQLIPKNNLGIPALINSATSWGDFDNDGDKDLAIMGYSFITGIVSRVYINNNGTFLNSSFNLERLQSGDIQWVDINKDGFLDLITCGLDINNQRKTILYKNVLGNELNKHNDVTISGVTASKISFGDTDNDGLLNLLLLGLDNNNKPFLNLYDIKNNGLSFEFKTNLAKNTTILESTMNNGYFGLHVCDINLDGDNDVLLDGGYGFYYGNSFKSIDLGGFSYLTSGFKFTPAKLYNDDSKITILGLVSDEDKLPDFFSNQSINFIGGSPRLKNGDISVGDFNIDGLNDILFSGIDETNTPKTLLYYQREDKTFAITPNVSLTNLYKSSSDWVDFDNDGDLDLFMTGIDINNLQQTILYENNSGLNQNLPPNKPINLRFLDKGNGFVELKWDNSVDDHSNFLSYNVRIGITPGGSELSNTHSNLQTGSRLITEIPTLLTKSYQTQLNPGNYYWSVQAIDHSNIGSQFADESFFSLQYDWKLVNHGGVDDNRILNIDKPKISLFDFDNDKDLDLLVGGSSSNDNILYAFDGKVFKKKYSPITPYSSFPGIENVTSGDLNNDGFIDFVINTINKNILVYLSNAGVFSNSYIIDGISLEKSKIKIFDSNNDGKQEIWVAGITSNTDSGIPKLFNLLWNGMGFTLSNLSSQISPLLFASYDFGDFNNDGNIDFIESGAGVNGLEAILYKNITAPGNPASYFSIPSNLVGTYKGTIDLNDLDSDGDLDILSTGTAVSGDVFRFYKNDISFGLPSFSNASIGLNSLRESKITLGDFNADGYQDVFFTGIQNGSSKITGLAEFNPVNQNYTIGSFPYGNLTDAETAFGDIDNDGDLDMILGGNDVANINNKIFQVLLNVRNESALVNTLSTISNPFQNQISKKEMMHSSEILTPTSQNIYNLNLPPQMPSIVSVEKLLKGSSEVLHFTWQRGSDDHTPVNGLTYNLRIGTLPEKDDILPSNSHNDGTRKLAQKGNLEHNISYDLALLPNGIYYWSVQTIDGSFIGSKFSPTHKFEMINGQLITNNPPIVNSTSVFISDFAPLNSLVSNIIASDMDTPILTYSIISGNEQNWFTINNSGQISVNQRPELFPDSVNIVVGVSDGLNIVEGTLKLFFCNSIISNLPNISADLRKTFYSNSTITTSSQIIGISKINLNSVSSIVLNPGTNISNGVVFKANIGQGCVN